MSKELAIVDPSGRPVKDRPLELSSSGEMPSPAQMLDYIIRAVRSKDLDLDRASFMLDIKDRIEAGIKAQQDRFLEAEFLQALTPCRLEMPHRIVTDAINAQAGNHKYTKLPTLERIIRPVWERNKFDVDWKPIVHEKPGGVDIIELQMRVIYLPNGWVETRVLKAPSDTKGPKGGDQKTAVQGLSSTASYLRRLHHILFWGLTFIDKSDNDGNTRGPYTEVTDENDASPDAVVLLSEAQKSTLTNLLNATGTSESKFCQRAGFKTLDDLPASKYETAKKLLMDKQAAARNA